MENRIGETIFTLRKGRNLTQQQLSEMIGVSIAAISKWETGNAHPDIELLPRIATIFDVSIDYLFNYHLSFHESLTNIIEHAKILFDAGQYSNAISMLSDASSRFPNDIDLKFNRAKMIIYSSVAPPIDSEKSNLLTEANKELQTVIDHAESRELIDESYYLICMSYINLKQFDRALDAITQIRQSNHINTGIALFRIYLEQGDLNNAKKQFELNLYLSLANIHANTIWTEKLFQDDYEKSIRFYEMAIETFKAYSGNSSCRFDVYISTFYERVALFSTKAKKYAKAIDSLQSASDYALSFDNLSIDNDLRQFDSLTASDTTWNALTNQKAHLLHTIENNMQEVYKELIPFDNFNKVIAYLKRE